MATLSSRFEWDESKNTSNIAKHGIDFRDAVRVFQGTTLDRLDDRPHRAYGEQRINSIGAIGEEIIVNVTHTDRDGVIRLISARRANKAERELFRAYDLGENP